MDDTTLNRSNRTVAILRSHDYQELELIFKNVYVCDHCAVAAPGIQAGLRLALAKR